MRLIVFRKTVVAPGHLTVRTYPAREGGFFAAADDAGLQGWRKPGDFRFFFPIGVRLKFQAAFPAVPGGGWNPFGPALRTDPPAITSL